MAKERIGTTYQKPTEQEIKRYPNQLEVGDKKRPQEKSKKQ